MRKKGKKSQVTVFIIIGILIIASIVFILIHKNYISIPSITNERLSLELSEVDKTLESCVKQRAIDAIRIVGVQGGYVTLPKNYLSTNLSNIAYGYYEGRNTLPKIEIIEKEISSYVNETLPYCLKAGDFSDHNITVGKSLATTKIKEETVSVTGTLKISIVKDKESLIADRKYSFDLPIYLKKINKVAENTINKIILEIRAGAGRLGEAESSLAPTLE